MLLHAILAIEGVTVRLLPTQVLAKTFEGSPSTSDSCCTLPVKHPRSPAIWTASGSLITCFENRTITFRSHPYSLALYITPVLILVTPYFLSCNGPFIWNQLPANIMQFSSFTMFKFCFNIQSIDAAKQIVRSSSGGPLSEVDTSV